MENKRKIGKDYEQKAAEYLEQKGFLILAKNFCSRYGEIDLIAKDDGYVVFIEVKYRRDGSCGDPLEAVNAVKQKRICRTASYFCIRHGYPDTTPCRFDVVALTGEGEFVHIQNAFDYRF